MEINNHFVANVLSSASAPTLTATPRLIPTEPPREDWKFLSTVGLPAVPLTGVPLVVASNVKSRVADVSMSAKTVAFAIPFRTLTPISRRGIRWASAWPVKVAAAPTLSLMAIQNMSAEREYTEYIEYDSRAFFGLMLAELLPAEAGKVNCSSGKVTEAPTVTSATIPRLAFAFALTVKEGPTARIPGKSSPGRPASKSLMS